MSERYGIIEAPEREVIVRSFFTEVVSEPELGGLPNPFSQIRAPDYLGETFLVRIGQELRRLPLIITGVARCGSRNVINFRAVLWTACDEFRDLMANDPSRVWAWFEGRLYFGVVGCPDPGVTGWLERIEPPC